MRKLEFSIAWRYLRSRSRTRLLSFISVVAIGGVMVGVSALIVIIGVMTGLQNDLREKILVGSPHMRVLTFGDDLRMENWRPTLERVRNTQGIVAAQPFVVTQGVMSAGRSYVEGVQVVGIEAGSDPSQDPTTIRQTAREPRAFEFVVSDTGVRGIVLGRRVAERFNVYPGNRVTLIGAQMNETLGQLVPRYMQFEVTGIFETGMYEYDNSYAYIPLDAAQEFGNLGDAVTGVEARARDLWVARDIAATLNEELGFPYRVVDWQEQNSSLFQALQLEKLAMAIILGLIVIVAAFNIVSTLTMVVRDKTREIGILKTMGMTGRSIRVIFLAQGIVIGLVGTGLGLALGLATGLALEKYRLIALDPSVYFIDHLPVQVQAADVLWIVLASLAIAALATLHPSRQAARLYPVEAIRDE